MSNAPTRQELIAAKQKFVPDVIAPHLKILFCGINPGLYSAAVGHHFARPGNRFWPALSAAGITPRLLYPSEDGELLQWGYGISNVVARTSATADELSKAELIEGGRLLMIKVEQYQPRVLAILGVGAYRAAFGRPKAAVGLQAERIGDTRLWILPNPSGLNAHYDLKQIAEVLRNVKQDAEQQERSLYD